METIRKVIPGLVFLAVLWIGIVAIAQQYTGLLAVAILVTASVCAVVAARITRKSG